MPWFDILKSMHIVFVVVWFAGLFYLGRLFVYHAMAEDTVSLERFKLMERRLFGMMTLGATLTIVFGVALLALAPGFLSMPWLHVKVALVALLVGYHVYSYRLLIAFRQDRNTRSNVWYRVFNELPLLVLIGAVLLVELKPSW